MPIDGAHEPLSSVERERLRISAPIGRRSGGPRRLRDRVEDDPELVATEAGDRVAGRRPVDQPLADGRKQPVADGVAEALVDDLEPVEVQQQDGDGLVIVRRWPASAWAIRSASRAPRLGSPVVVVSTARPRCATSTSRALSSPIDASLAKEVRASISRAPSVAHVPGGEAQDPDDLGHPRVRGTPHDRAEGPGRQVVRPSGVPGVVVVDRRLGRSLTTTAPPGPRPSAGQPSNRSNTPVPPWRSSRAVPSGSSWHEAVRRPEQGRGAGDDVESQPCGRGDPAGRARSRRGPRGTDPRGRRPPDRSAVPGLDEVQRAVGDRDELVLGASVVREAGDAGADGDGRADDRGGRSRAA